ncbi:MAG TPA: hypothetical protein VLS47_05545 [Gallionella sp.]|nr:hypothetical protein [Gallionella sp.]
MAELSEDIYAEIRRLCSQGDRLAEACLHHDALDAFHAAWALLPEPKTEWRAATSILVAIGDASFQVRDYRSGRHSLLQALKCPDAFGDPFLYLRLGQCQLELEAYDKATDALMRAYLGGGPDIFKGEDPKYHLHLQARDPSVRSPRKTWQFWK